MYEVLRTYRSLTLQRLEHAKNFHFLCVHLIELFIFGMASKWQHVVCLHIHFVHFAPYTVHIHKQMLCF